MFAIWLLGWYPHTGMDTDDDAPEREACAVLIAAGFSADWVQNLTGVATAGLRYNGPHDELLAACRGSTRAMEELAYQSFLAIVGRLNAQARAGDADAVRSLRAVLPHLRAAAWCPACDGPNAAEREVRFRINNSIKRERLGLNVPLRDVIDPPWKRPAAPPARKWYNRKRRPVGCLPPDGPGAPPRPRRRYGGS